MSALQLVTVLVHDQDAALAFFAGALGFDVVQDETHPDGSRWLVVRPAGATETGLLLALADDDDTRARVGHQTGSRVAMILTTDDFARDHARMLAHGVVFHEQPRHESYGTVAVFEDLGGNRWDLLERRD